MSGVINANAGLREKYGGDFLLTFRNSSYNIFFAANYNKRNYPSFSKSRNETFNSDTTSYIYSEGDSKRDRTIYGFQGGVEFFFKETDILKFSGRYGGRSMEDEADLDFDEWADPGIVHNLYLSRENGEHGGDYYSIITDYSHKFEQKGHELTGRLYFSKREGDEESINELLDDSNTIISGQKSSEKGPENQIRFNLDYTLPLNEKNRFEAGVQSRVSKSDNINKVYYFNANTGEYEFQQQYSHSSEYKRNIHSLYTMYAGEMESFGYQLGMRGEYTYRLIELIGEDKDFTIDRWDYFPTLHFSYKYSDTNQMMVSYTRRIDRPRGWYLEPFITWSDAYNVRSGNPSLKPEYIDSYELAYQNSLGKSVFSLEAYYRITHNLIERVRSVYTKNIFLHTTENVGKEYNFGSEMMLNTDILKEWNINLMGNLYNYKIVGDLFDEHFSRESFNWRIRLNNTFNLLKSTRIQIDGSYNSRSVSSQGERQGNFTTNAAIRHDIISRKLSAILQARDLFGSSKREYTSEGKDFYSYSYQTREAPMVTLTLRYNFNNYKSDRKQNGEEEFEGDEEF